MSQVCHPFTFHTPMLTKEKQTLALSLGFQLFHAGPTAFPLFACLSPISPYRCMVPKLAIIPAFEMIFTNTYARSQNTSQNSKPISEATKKHVLVSYLKNKGDIRRVWRAAFPILVVIGTASSYDQAVFRTIQSIRFVLPGRTKADRGKRDAPPGPAAPYGVLQSHIFRRYTQPPLVHNFISTSLPKNSSILLRVSFSSIAALPLS